MAKEVMTPQEVCEEFHISLNWLYYLTGNKKIKHYHPQGSRRTYFRRCDVEEFFLANEVAAETK